MSKCPNISSPEWKDLVAELGNSRILAMEAYKKNGYDIPELDSQIVKDVKKLELKFGPSVEVVKDNDGKETDNYKSVRGSKLYNRISIFVGNFAAKVKDGKKTFAERTADKFWGALPHDEKLVTKFGLAQTRNEYVEELEYWNYMAVAKGLVMHLAIQKKLTPGRAKELQSEISAILAEVLAMRGEVPFSWEWIEHEETITRNGVTRTESVIEDIFDNLNLNFFHELTLEEEVLRDVITSEVTVSSNVFNMAGTIDMLVHHADNTYSIIDWKTGNSMNKVFRGMDDLIMKYGNQGTREIEDSIRNRAKLQIALYAVLLRAENPHIKFRSLDLAWIPNRYDSLQKDLDSSVDVQAFIPMIEQFLRDPLAVEAAGLPRNIHAKLLENDSQIFNPTLYNSSAKTNVVTDMMTKDSSPEEALESRIEELKYLLGGSTNYDDLSYTDKQGVKDLLEEINSRMAAPGVSVDTTVYEDMSFVNLWLGNYSEVKHPMVQQFKKYKDAQQLKAKRSAEVKITHFRSLLRPILKQYYKDQNIKKILGNRAINYDKLFAWMYIDEGINTETTQTRERLLTKQETDPALIAKYNALTIEQQRLLDYTNDTFSDYFNGPKAIMNDIAISRGSVTMTQLELFNKAKSDVDKRKWHQGFFFKVAPTDEDIITRSGNGSYIKGKFSKKALGSLIFKYATFFKENEFDGWNNETQALPLKFMGSDIIDSSRTYTKNMEMIFSEAVSEMEFKKEMDGVYALGQAIKVKLDTEKRSSGEPAYANLVKFLDHRLMMDIQRKMHIAGARGRAIRIPMYTPDGWHKEKVSLDALIRGLTKWTSMNTMWVRPFQGVGNGVHAMMLTHRDGLKGALSGVKLLGISGDSVDFTSKDLIQAEAAYFSDYLKKVAFGDFRSSKMFLLAKEFNYFGNNYDYAEMEKTILSLRNRYMSEGTMYLFHSMPEEFVSMTTMAAQLMHMKNKVTGKSIWNSYETEEIMSPENKGTGEFKLKWTGGIRGYVQKSSGTTAYTETLTELDSQEQAKLRKVHERLQGGYRKDEATIIEAYAMGKMFIHLKKYLPRLILNAFHSKRMETDLGAYKKLMDPVTGKPIYKDENGVDIPVYEWQARLTEGRIITLVNHIIMLSTAGRLNRDYRWNELSDEQKQNLIEAALTLSIYLAAYGAYITWFDELDDDDTTKKWFKMYMVDNLSQQYNMVDLSKTMATAFSPVAFAKVGNFAVHGSKMVVAAAEYSVGNEDAALTKKGDLKGWNSFVKTVPLLSSYYDAKNRFRNVKDPDSFINAGLDVIRLK